MLHISSHDVGGARQELKKASLVFQPGEADWLALGERRARALAVFERKDFGAVEAAGAGEERYEVAETGVADSAASEAQMEGQAQAAAPAAAPEPAEAKLEAQAAPLEPGAQQAWAEPRRAAAAKPHKRLAVAAGTAVGDAVGAGERQAGGAGETTGEVPARHGGR